MAKIETYNPINDFGGLNSSSDASRDPLSKLNNNFNARVKFPKDIETAQHYVTFDIKKRTKLRYYEATSKEQIIGQVKLPLPSTIATQYAAQYQSTELGFLGAEAVSAIENKSFNQAASEVGSSIANFLGKISNAEFKFEDVLTNETLQRLGNDLVASNALAIGGAITAGAAKIGERPGRLAKIGGPLLGALGALAGDEASKLITAAIAAGFQVARNPHMAQLYVGTGFRTHNFTYKLIARDRSDIESIKSLIKLFKYHMSPEYSEATHFLKYPAVFDIEFSNPKYMHKFGTSILSEFSVNYTGENTPIFFNNDGDSAPYSVVIGLSFTELDIVTKKEVEKDF